MVLGGRVEVRVWGLGLWPVMGYDGDMWVVP